MNRSNRLCQRLLISIIAVLNLTGGVAYSNDTIADTPKLYVGAGYGRTFADWSLRDFSDGSLSRGTIDKHDSGWKVIAGYWFTSAFAIEFGHADLNNDVDKETTFNAVSDGSGRVYAQGPISVDLDEPKGQYVALVSRLPLLQQADKSHSQLNLIGKLGLFSSKVTYTQIDSRGKTQVSEDNDDLMFGVGLQYFFLRNLSGRLEWETFKNIFKQDFEMYSVNIIYGF